MTNFNEFLKYGNTASEKRKLADNGREASNIKHLTAIFHREPSRNLATSGKYQAIREFLHNFSIHLTVFTTQ